MTQRPLVTVTPDPRGQRALTKLIALLVDGRKAEQNAATRILKKARQNAAVRPTPQARMVASGMIARRGVVIGFGSKRVFGRGAEQGVKLGFVAFASEFGSKYRQFRRSQDSAGLWLHPAAERNPDMDKVLEEHVDDAIDGAIRVTKVGI